MATILNLWHLPHFDWDFLCLLIHSAIIIMTVNMFIGLLVCLCLTSNFCTYDQHATPYLCNFHESSIISVWYPAVSLATPNHHCLHQFLQATFISSMNSMSTSSLIKSLPLPFHQSKKKLKLVLLYLCILLIIQSCDTESNPGPRIPKYPCGVCSTAVRWSRTRMAVACDTCDTWFHCDCMGMSSISYDRINRSDATLICSSCNTPNYSTSLSDSYISETSNPFDPLSNLSSTLDPEVAPNSSNLSRLESCSSEASESDFGSPIKRSSPIKRPNRRKNTSRPLKILSVNLQSLNAKKRGVLGSRWLLSTWHYSC